MPIKAKPLKRKTKLEERELPFDRFVASLKANSEKYALLGAVVVFAVIFLIVYSSYSGKREVTAIEVFEQALAAETDETKISLFGEVVNDYGRSPVTYQALYYLAEAHYRVGNVEEARETFQRYLKKYSKSQLAPEAQEALGHIEEDAGAFADAVVLYRKVAEGYPTSFAARRAWLNAGRCYEALGDKTAAVDAYTKVVSLHPGSTWAEKAEKRLVLLEEAGPKPADGQTLDISSEVTQQETEEPQPGSEPTTSSLLPQ